MNIRRVVKELHGETGTGTLGASVHASIDAERYALVWIGGEEEAPDDTGYAQWVDAAGCLELTEFFTALAEQLR